MEPRRCVKVRAVGTTTVGRVEVAGADKRVSRSQLSLTPGEGSEGEVVIVRVGANTSYVQRAAIDTRGEWWTREAAALPRNERVLAAVGDTVWLSCKPDTADPLPTRSTPSPSRWRRMRPQPPPPTRL